MNTHNDGTATYLFNVLLNKKDIHNYISTCKNSDTLQMYRIKQENPPQV